MILGFDTLWGRPEVGKFLKWPIGDQTLHEVKFECLLSHPEMPKLVTDMRVALARRLAWHGCIRDYMMGESNSRDLTI